MITVRLPEPLRNGRDTMTVNTAVHSLGELISILERDLPGFTEERDELFNFAVNGELILHGERRVPLNDGDEVEVVVAFSGG